jgi:hypothetical protein
MRYLVRARLRSLRLRRERSGSRGQHKVRRLRSLRLRRERSGSRDRRKAPHLRSGRGHGCTSRVRRYNIGQAASFGQVAAGAGSALAQSESPSSFRPKATTLDRLTLNRRQGLPPLREKFGQLGPAQIRH